MRTPKPPSSPRTAPHVQSLSRYRSRPRAAARWVAQRLLLRNLVWVVTDVSVHGRENVASLRGSFVVVANHSSHLDAPLVMGALPARLARYLAAGAAADYFFESGVRRRLTSLFFNAFPVERQRRKGSAPGAALAPQLLNAGVPVLLFPEGTRSHTGEMARFKPGAAALCLSVGVPCVPVAIVGASAAMPRGRRWPLRGRPPIAVRIGEPLVALPEESVRGFSARIEAHVRALLDGGQAPGEGGSA